MKTIVMKAKATHGEQGDVQQYLTSRSCRDDVRQFLNAALSENTLRDYRTDLQHFIAWGGVIPAPPEMIATYLAQHATTLAGTTLSRRLVAIARAHAARGLPSPTSSALVRATLQGVRRSLTNTVRQVAPLQKAQLLRMVHGLKDLRGLRDTAMLLIGSFPNPLGIMRTICRATIKSIWCLTLSPSRVALPPVKPCGWASPP